MEELNEDTECRQVYVIQSEGPDGLHNTEVVITDLGEIGENAIVVFEEAVGVGAEEIVDDQGYEQQEFQLISDPDAEALQAFHGVEPLKLEPSSYQEVKLEPHSYQEVKLEPDLTYETVEGVEDGEPQHVYFNVGLDAETETEEVLAFTAGTSEQLLPEQPLNLVKRDRKRKPSAHSEYVICKLCNSYVVHDMLSVHNRDVHANEDRLTCSDCGKLFTSKRSLFGHKKEKHSGPMEIHACPDCGKNFSRKSNLKAHRDSLHFGKKFPCTLCERIFTNRSSMNQHIKKTHSNPLVL
jgi:uncharacterized C2H2 Zn-finger protein